MQTPDLLLVAAGILGLIIVLTAFMGRLGIYDEKMGFSAPLLGKSSSPADGNPLQRRYLMLIAAALLMAQLVSPLVEFQFMKIVETVYPEREVRTATLSVFFGVLSGFSIVVNLIITPFILRRLGILAGLLVQPVMLAAATFWFSLHSGFIAAAVMKIADRGLSYSINRAAKELLYIPVDTLVMYQAKAWIDMFGYRTFKMVGALLILLLTQWTSLAPAVISLNGVIIGGCVVWVGVLTFVYQDYRILSSRDARGVASSIECAIDRHRESG